jgi:flagellar assembly protein FliH
MSLSNNRFLKSRVTRGYQVKLSDKKFRVNPPEGWEEEEAEREKEEEAKKAEYKQRLIDLEMTDIAEIRERELATIEILKEQIIGEASKDSKRMMDQARAETDKLMRDTITKAEAEKNRIHEEAYSAGFEEGAAAGAAEGERLANEAAGTLEDAKATRQRMIDNLEPELVDLISGIADKLIRKKAVFSPQLILHLIKAGLAEIGSADASGDISVLVSEDDYDTVIENKDELLKIVGGGAKLEIVRDPSLNKSDCVVKTAFGFIDVSLSQSFDELKENLYLISNDEAV